MGFVLRTGGGGSLFTGITRSRTIDHGVTERSVFKSPVRTEERKEMEGISSVVVLINRKGRKVRMIVG